jgi:protein TonB
VSAQTQTFQHASVLSGRQMVMVVTIALHGAVIAALMAIRIMPDVFKQPPSIIASFDSQPEVQPPPPQALDVPIRSTPIVVPVVPLIDLPPDIPVSEATLVAQPTPAGADATGIPEGAGTNVVPDIPSTPLQFQAVRSADDYYPAASLRLQEEGLVVVRVCVAPTGRLDGRPSIERSSGSPRLDAAALTWAREALRFTPATRNGEAIAACKGFRVNFRLH